MPISRFVEFNEGGVDRPVDGRTVQQVVQRIVSMFLLVRFAMSGFLNDKASLIIHSDFTSQWGERPPTQCASSGANCQKAPWSQDKHQQALPGHRQPHPARKRADTATAFFGRRRLGKVTAMEATPPPLTRFVGNQYFPPRQGGSTGVQPANRYQIGCLAGIRRTGSIPAIPGLWPERPRSRDPMPVASVKGLWHVPGFVRQPEKSQPCPL